MAFRSNSPITLTLPPFRGVTRQIVLAAVVMYLCTLVLGLVLPGMYVIVVGFLLLEPRYVMQKLVWELVTYPFIGRDLLGVAFSALSVWFFGSTLEAERGRRWMSEFFLLTTIAGAILTCALAYAIEARIWGIASTAASGGLWPFAMSLVVAFAVFHPEENLRFYFLFTLKAKYLAAIYLLVYLALMLLGRDSFGILLVLCNVVAAYAYLKLAPRRGLRVKTSEWMFGVRNEYYRWKRRRAAKKFVVYMRKQGKEVSLDAEGRYVDPDGKPHDAGDRRWMN